MKAYLNPKCQDIELYQNPYRMANFWLYKICWFVDHECNHREEPDLNFKSLNEILVKIIQLEEPVTHFLNKERQKYSNTILFASTLKTDSHTVLIPKTKPEDKALYENNKPEELSTEDSMDLCLHWAKLCTTMYKAEQAVLLAPESIAETWPAILPSGIGTFQIAEVLMRILPLNVRMAVYRYCSCLPVKNNWKEEFFANLFWDLFEIIGSHREPAKRQIYISLIGDFMPYLKTEDFELLLSATIRNSYGDSNNETPWAFARLYMAEILFKEHKLHLNSVLSGKITELALAEMDEYDECIEIDWKYDSRWVEMLDSLVLFSEVKGLDALLLKRIQEYNEKRGRAL